MGNNQSSTSEDPLTASVNLKNANDLLKFDPAAVVQGIVNRNSNDENKEVLNRLAFFASNLTNYVEQAKQNRSEHINDKQQQKQPDMIESTNMDGGILSKVKGVCASIASDPLGKRKWMDILSPRNNTASSDNKHSEDCELPVNEEDGERNPKRQRCTSPLKDSKKTAERVPPQWLFRDFQRPNSNHEEQSLQTKPEAHITPKNQEAAGGSIQIVSKQTVEEPHPRAECQDGNTRPSQGDQNVQARTGNGNEQVLDQRERQCHHPCLLCKYKANTIQPQQDQGASSADKGPSDDIYLSSEDPSMKQLNINLAQQRYLLHCLRLSIFQQCSAGSNRIVQINHLVANLSQLQQCAVALTQYQINQNLDQLGLKSRIEGAGPGVAHLVLHPQWDDQPSAVQLHWWIPEKPRSKGASPTEREWLPPIPVFWMQPLNYHDSNQEVLYYIGHYQFHRFHPTQKGIVKGIPRHGLVEFQFAEFSTEMANRMAGIANNWRGQLEGLTRRKEELETTGENAVQQHDGKTESSA